MPAPFWPLAALLVLIPVYVYSEYKSPSWQLKLVLKALCSVLIAAAAFLSAIAAPNGWRGWDGMFLPAFLCCLTGDILLALPGGRSFNAGLGFYFAAQCTFAEAFVTRWGLSPWDSAAFAVLAGVALVVLWKAPGMDFGPLKFAAMLYALALSACVAAAVSGVWIAGWPHAWAAAAGGLLFYASETMFAFITFGGRKSFWLRALCLTTHCAGMGLLALSLYF